MTIKQKLLLVPAVLLVFSLLSSALLSPAAFADVCKDVKNSTSILNDIKCGEGDGVVANPIWGMLILVINIMTAGVAVAAIGGFIYASILYATAEDRAAQVTKAKETIFNVILGLVLYALMYALLQFIIPGGIFS